MYEKIIAATYLVILVVNILGTPFFFGEDKGKYDAKGWLFTTITIAPLVFLLYKIVFK